MDAYKKNIEDQIVDKIADGIEKGQLEEEDLPKISNFVLTNIDKVTTHDQLVGFLSVLSIKWPIFSNLAILEEGKIKEKLENRTAESVLKLIQNGNLKEAIKLSEQVNKL